MSALGRTCSVALVLGGLVYGSALAQTNERGLDPKNFDTTISPCSDFYQYANGNWCKNNPVPPEYGSWSVGHEIHERNFSILHDILEKASKDGSAPKGSARQKIGDFFTVAMDTAKIEAEGSKPLKADLDRIAAVKSLKDLQQLIADLHAKGENVVFDVGADQDMKNNVQIIVYATQGGLSLPDRDYYTRDDEESKKLREQYLEYVTNMLKLLGDDDTSAKAQAQKIMEIETRLAKASLTNVEQRDPNTWYNYITVKQADSATPDFSWSAYFKAIGLSHVESFSFAHPKFFAEMNQLFKEIPVEDWKSYCRWHILSGAAPTLSSEFVNERFRFVGTVLQGTKVLQPRWKRVLNATNQALGEVLGQLYVERVFPPKSKSRAMEMVNNLREALKARINNLEWMSAETKTKALEKLAAFTPKIGYPDKWRDYSSLSIEKDSYWANVSRGRTFEMRRQLNKIGKPVDRTEWGMTPQTVNAYYNPLMNEIVFPAAILQPPEFDGDADDALNYGAMGSVIGHEMTHGFDDEGSQFDAVGNLKNWWTEEDRKKFDERTQKLVEQFDKYVAVDSMHVNGKLTLGENIADLGGLLVAYDAFKLALAAKPQKEIDGLSPEKRFFLGYAQGWRTNYRPQTLKLQINTDPHSPSNLRVTGPLSNLKEFNDAFGCPAGEGMTRSELDRVRIW